MDSEKNQVIDRLTKATNVLVTVSTNPTVDQLAGAIGLTLLLNKIGKHATAVFSGKIPDTIEFLQPEKTLEKTTDSLRDFIIALDKAKADKLRYKVEDQMVKIFITPYRTSISEKDLEFSQGDFNVDVVMALGVNEQKDLDQAITAHGRILHDATVIGVNTHAGAKLGAIDWVQTGSSSLCEMLVDMGLEMKADVLDSQMATAFLTGIVAETNRFSNEKTSSLTMQMSAKLMTAGANQQLVATQLQPKEVEAKIPKDKAPQTESAELPEPKPESSAPKPTPPTPEPVEESSKPAGSLVIDHEEPQLTDADEPKVASPSQIDIDPEGHIKPIVQPAKPAIDNTPHYLSEPPALGDTMVPYDSDESLDKMVNPLSESPDKGVMLSHDTPPANVTDALKSITSADEPPSTLKQLEESVNSPHISNTPPAPVSSESHDAAGQINSARDAVQQAVSATTPQILEPVYSLNAKPMDVNLDKPDQQPSFPPGLFPQYNGPPVDNTASPVESPTAPPPVPPPMMPPMPSQPDDQPPNLTRI